MGRVLVGHGILAEHDPRTGSNRPPGHLGVLAAPQPEAVVEQGLDTVGDLGGEEQATRCGVAHGCAGGVAAPAEQRLVDPSGVARLEHRLHHAVHHVGLVPGQRLEHGPQPVRGEGHVVVDEGDEATRPSRGDGAVAGRGDPWPRLAVVGHRKRAVDGGGDLPAGPAGVVVDDEHPNGAPGRDVELLERPQEPGQGPRAPVGDHADGHIEPATVGRAHAAAAATVRSEVRRRDRRTATAAHSETARTTSAQ